MQTTANYGLKKPAGTDVVNIDDLNGNADIIDSELKKRAFVTDIPAVPVKSVNGKAGTIILSAGDIKTADGTTIEALKNEVDSHKADDVKHITAAERTAWNGKQAALGYTPINKSGDAMAGILTAQSNTSYTVRQVHNMILSTADADVNSMQNGDIWVKYE